MEKSKKDCRVINREIELLPDVLLARVASIIKGCLWKVHQLELEVFHVAADRHKNNII